MTIGKGSLGGKATIIGGRPARLVTGVMLALLGHGGVRCYGGTDTAKLGGRSIGSITAVVVLGIAIMVIHYLSRGHHTATNYGNGSLMSHVYIPFGLPKACAG